MASSAGYTNIHGTTVSPSNGSAMRIRLPPDDRQRVENPAAFTSTTTNRPWIAFTIGFPGGDTKWAGAETHHP